MADPSDILQLLTNLWPTTATAPAETTMQSILVSIGKRIGTLPINYAAFVGQPLVTAADGSGPTVLSASGIGAFDFGGVPLKNGKTDQVTISGGGVLSDASHRGRDILFTGTSSASLSLNLDPTGVLGVTNGFNCHIYRAYDGGATGQLHIAVGSGITLQRPDAALGVPAGNGIAVKLFGTRLFIGNAVA